MAKKRKRTVKPVKKKKVAAKSVEELERKIAADIKKRKAKFKKLIKMINELWP